ncbi:hypothetical protein MSG28_013304 [Choristoneura fumiferana]|uniref:Uncharacterized protein n=1 Tax=Choristoneura fumiferana TaxID=7141 RepID=A0ACC0KTP6_CHOFU|nr:hypothetical protein MSG28_013304 [Choristoneura fumiferana]
MYLDKLTEKDYLAAVALMCLKYSLNVASDKCAESAEAPPAKKLKHDEPMEVTEQAAGPSGKPKPCNRLQLVLKERLRDLNNNNKSKNWTIDGLVPIGTGNTFVPEDKLDALRDQNYRFATRSLMDALFAKSVLATSSVTGRPSPAFPDMPAKSQLNPEILKDIEDEIIDIYKVTPDMVRLVMTTKCADEAKMARNAGLQKRKKRKNRKRPGDRFRAVKPSPTSSHLPAGT